VTASSKTSASILGMGNDSTVVAGTSFTGASAVSFGGTTAGAYQVLSDNAIQVTAPAHVAGQVDVNVVAPDGTSVNVPADGCDRRVGHFLLDRGVTNGPKH
jgi:hypothetical protein